MQSVLEISPTNLNDTSAMPVVIDIEQFNRGAAYGGDADQTQAIGRPREMLAPLVATRMEQGHDHLSREINSLSSVPATLVTVSAGECEILGVITTIRRLRHDMVQRETDELPAFVRMAVFATRCRSFANDSLRRRRDCHDRVIASARRVRVD